MTHISNVIPAWKEEERQASTHNWMFAAKEEITQKSLETRNKKEILITKSLGDIGKIHYFTLVSK